MKKVWMIMCDDGEYGYASLYSGQVYSSKEAAEAAKAELDRVDGHPEPDSFIREFDVLDECEAKRAVDVDDNNHAMTTIEYAE